MNQESDPSNAIPNPVVDTIGPAKIRFRRLAIAVVLTIGLFAGLYLFLTEYRPAPTVLLLTGDRETLGRAHGDRLKLQINVITKLYLEKYLCGGDDRKLKDRYTRASMLAGGIPQPYRDEIEAIANACNLPAHGIMYGNCFLDIGQASIGCRSIVTEVNGRVLHGHNLDWDDIAGLSKWITCVFPGILQMAACGQWRLDFRAWLARWISSMKKGWRSPLISWDTGMEYVPSRSL